MTRQQLRSTPSPLLFPYPTLFRFMLTSMLNRADVASYNAFKDAAEGNWTSGIQNLGLADDGVGWALDEYNKDLITEEMKAMVEEAAADIVAGKLTVHDY